MHETVTMKLFARLGIPAPREAHVRLYVNDQYAGLYAVVESIDKNFLARIFGIDWRRHAERRLPVRVQLPRSVDVRLSRRGLEPYKARFDPKTHENKSDAELYGPIENLVRLANELEPAQFQPVLGEHLDLHGVHALRRGAELRRPERRVPRLRRHEQLLPLPSRELRRVTSSSPGTRTTRSGVPISRSSMRHDDNVLMRKAMQVPDLHAAYNNLLAEAAAVSDEVTGPDQLGWFEYETRRQLDLVYDALRDDPAKPYTMEDHDNARNAVTLFARERSRNVREQMGLNGGLRRPE